jgi:hypothetical protein
VCASKNHSIYFGEFSIFFFGCKFLSLFVYPYRRRKGILSCRLAYQKYNFVTAPILNLGNKLRWGVSFTPQPLYLQRVHPVWLVGRSGQELVLLPLISRLFCRPTASLLTIPIALSRLTRSLDVCKWPTNASPYFNFRVLFIITTPLSVRPLHRMWHLEEWSKTKKD